MASGTKTTAMFKKRLDELVEDHKAKTGMGQNQIAQEIGIAPSALSDYLADKKEAGINTLRRIADYFEVSCDYLMGRAVCRTPENEEVQKKYGLDDETLNVLKNMKSTGMGGEVVLSRLLKKGFDQVLSDVFDIMLEMKRTEQTQTKLQQIYNQMQDGKIVPMTDRESRPIPGLYTATLSFESYMNYRLQKLQRTFYDMTLEVIQEQKEVN